MISVITPSVRPEMLEIVGKCLDRQTFKDFEWIIVSPHDLSLSAGIWHCTSWLVKDPKKNKKDYYCLNKAWNAAFKEAKGEIVVSIQDGIWFPPDTLERFWDHYQANPISCVGGFGNQYDQIENGKPEHCVWVDPRKREGTTSFQEVIPNEIEFSVASIPKRAIFDVGGIDEEFDKYAALSEKELVYRIKKLGYKFYLDQGIEYKAIKHPRLNDSWEEHYQAGIPYYEKCLREIQDGKRLKLEYLS